MCGKKGGERVRAAGMDENDFFPGWTLRVEAAAAGVIGGDRICLGVISTSFLTGLWLIPIPTSRCFLSLFSTRRLETWLESLALPIRPHKLLGAGSTAKRSDETRRAERRRDTVDQVELVSCFLEPSIVSALCHPFTTYCSEQR